MNFHFSYFHFLYNLLKGVLMSVLLLTVSSHRALTSPEGLRHWAWCRQLLWSLEQDRPWCLLSVAGFFLCNPVILVSTTFYNSLFEIFLIMIKLNTFISKAVSLSFDTYQKWYPFVRFHNALVFQVGNTYQGITWPPILRRSNMRPQMGLASKLRTLCGKGGEGSQT